MQFHTPIEKFHYALQPLLREFARKSHALNLIVLGSLHQRNIETLDTIDYRKVNFYDPRFVKDGRSGEWEHEPVGTLQLSPEPDGYHFIVSSRLIQNEKYKKHSSDYYTKTSKNITKVIKTLLESVRPYTYTEIYRFHEKRMRDVVGSWRSEHYRTVNSTFGPFGSRTIVYEEVKYLRGLGVQFKTKEFQEMASTGVEAYEEYMRREKQPLTKYHVFLEPNRVSVTACEEGEHGFDKVPKHLYVCDSIDKLGDDVLAEVSLLKMLDVGKDIIGIGARVSERDYLVIKPLASATNA